MAKKRGKSGRRREYKRDEEGKFSASGRVRRRKFAKKVRRRLGLAKGPGRPSKRALQRREMMEGLKQHVRTMGKLYATAAAVGVAAGVANHYAGTDGVQIRKYARAVELAAKGRFKGGGSRSVRSVYRAGQRLSEFRKAVKAGSPIPSGGLGRVVVKFKLNRAPAAIRMGVSRAKGFPDMAADYVTGKITQGIYKIWG